MQKPALCRALAQNLAVLQDRFGGSDDFYTKKLSVGGIRCAMLHLLRGILHRLALALRLTFLLLLCIVPLQDTHRRAGYGVLLPCFRLLHGGTGLDITHFAPPAWWSSGGTAPCRVAAR